LPQNNLSPNADSFYDKLDSADQVPNSGLENITSGLIQDFVARSSGYAVGPVTIQNNGRSSTVDVIDFNPHPQGGHIQAALYQFVRYSSGCDGLGASCAPSQDGGSYTSNVRYLGRYDPSGDQTLAGALDEVNTFLDQARKNPLGFPSAVERIIQRISPGSTCTQGTLDFTTLAGHYPLPLAFAAAGEGASQQPQPIRLVRSGIVLPSSSPGYNGYLVNARQHGETLYGGDYGAGGVTDFPAFSPSFNNIVAYNVEGGKQDQSAITGYKYQYYAPCTSSNSEFFHRVDGVATCAGYVGTALDAAAFILLLVPGGQPFAAAAAALGATATVLNTTTTGYQTARLVFDQGYRDSPQNRAGVILGIGSLALGVFGNALTKRAVQQAEGEVNAAIARGAPKAAIESLMGAKEDTERLAHFANAYFASDVVVLDLANQFQQAQPGPSATDVVGPSSTADLYIVARVGTNDGR